ncbi:MAG: hypothetical protein M5T52_09010 [Ignavibacteriaceae bacterium]|nr:hypothetical protein [Ignavibacteriaceae bacterium]
MKTKLDIAKSWLHRYTGTKIDEFGDYMLLTNFADYVEKFAKKFNTEIKAHRETYADSYKLRWSFNN